MAQRHGELDTYRDKRDFSRTDEPAGVPGDNETGDRFVVQRHRARRRHYDLRLEMGGVLASWAVPKGPTLDPEVRRLAVHVEDHPVEYADFEGVIPAGEYGGGDVIVWDRGTWTPVDTEDPVRAVEEGTLHFDVYGEKLRGRFVLVRPRRSGTGTGQWLLLHKHDRFATVGWDPEDHPVSVKSGRTNPQVAADPDARWHGDRPAPDAEETISRRPSTPAGRRRHWTPVDGAVLEDLDRLGRTGTWHVDDHALRLTNLDKILAPGRDDEPDLSKRDIIRYLTTVAPVMLPYLVDRAVTTHRFPAGVTEPGFWQRQLPAHAPKWLRRWEYHAAGRDRHYLVPDRIAAMVWLANHGALELHGWTGRVDDVEHPDWALFDIDPGERTEFAEVVELARLHRAALDHLGVVGKPKVTGQRGIQIWVPLEPCHSFARTRSWVETVSRSVGATVPELVSWKWNVEQRGGLARLDYTQNALNKTLVAPYSPRPRPGLPVSVPLEWHELDDPALRPDGWTVRTVLDRLAEVGDPFAELLDVRQRLPSL